MNPIVKTFPRRGAFTVLPRQALLAASLAAALTLNAIALAMVGAVTARWHAAPQPPGTVAWVTAMSLDATSTHPTNPASADPSQRALADDERFPPGKQKTVTRAPRAAAVPVDPGSTLRFFKFAEVDRAARPDSDWNLDPAALDAAGVGLLVFEIFVGRDGAVVECTILEPQTLSPEARSSLESRLRQTTLTPALRDGRAVASVRRIAVSVLPAIE